MGDLTQSTAMRPAHIRMGLIALASIAFGLTLLATRNGPRLELDSLTYLSTAQNIVDGVGLRDFTLEPLSAFPPGLPLLLALGGALGASVEDVARFTQAVAFAGMVVAAYFLLRRHVASMKLVFGATTFVAFSPLLVDQSAAALSDLLFAVLVVCFLLALESAVEADRRGWRPVLLSAVLVWAGFMVRYAALALLATGVLALAFKSARFGLASLLQRVGFFVGVAALVPLAWALRNEGLGQDPLGPRVATNEGPLHVVWLGVRVIAGLVTPTRAPASARVLFGVTLGLVLVIALVVFALDRGKPTRKRTSSPLVLVTFLVTYVLFALASRRFAGAGLDRRILAPTFVPLVVVVAAVLDATIVRVDVRSRALGRALRVTACCWMAFLIVFCCWLAWDDGRAQRGVNASSAGSDALAELVRRAEADASFVSNDPWRAFMLGGRQPVRYSPGVTPPGSSLRPGTIKELVKEVECTAGPTYLIWFGPTDESPGFLESPAELRMRLRLREEAKSAAGTIFELRSRDASEACGD